jgi:hypothetical protein
VTALATLRALLAHIVDYAGTFPPASLPLTEAVANYAREQESSEAWLLGRLVVSPGNLDELERVWPNRLAGEYPLSVILGADAPAQLGRVRAFNERRAGGARIASVEFSPGLPAGISGLMRDVDHTLEAFFEAPLDSDLETRLDAIAAAGASAKVRTGGTTPATIPSPALLAGFVHACAQRGLSFKATAGLHHATRSCYPLTYERDSSTAVMHGFLNVAVAAALAKTGAGITAIGDALAESSAEALVATARLQDPGGTRQFFRSFGSCSFREPADELARMNLLEPT